jgi:hypothetical protein
MNCDKKFLFALRLETGGYALGLLHSGASVVVLVLCLNNLEWFSNAPVWCILGTVVLWIFHFVSSVLLLIGTAKVGYLRLCWFNC